jgi:hypothetical protein
VVEILNTIREISIGFFTIVDCIGDMALIFPKQLLMVRCQVPQVGYWSLLWSHPQNVLDENNKQKYKWGGLREVEHAAIMLARRYNETKYKIVAHAFKFHDIIKKGRGNWHTSSSRRSISWVVLSISSAVFKRGLSLYAMTL